MPPQKQDYLDVKISCSEIKEAVIIKAEITESVSNLFIANVFLQTSKQIDIEKVVNSNATITMSMDYKTTRQFSGIVEMASFENIPSTISVKMDSILYIKIVPTLSRALYTKKYRSFQEQSAKDIIQSVLKENNISNVKIDIKSSGNEKRTFCVQYGESDPYFISRLMEEEGIFYYFEHLDNKDVLNISDSSLSATKIKTKLRIRKSASNADITTDSVYNVSFSSSIGTNKIDSFSYNETKADVIKGTSEDTSNKSKIGEKEFYDQLFLEKTNGDKLSKTLLECENSIVKKLTGISYCPELYTGCIFDISGSVTENHNGEFFAISMKHTINQLPEDINTPIYSNSFVAIPSNIPFRPVQTHLKNRIVGCQTATVTGPSGEEIFCDENSRIKVKFHWDSRTQKDEKSSCWIRVAQTWAGGGFGSLIIPRVGMEVRVDFINGDPDQPLVTGCVYNGVNKPPSNYPKEKNTVSTFYTNSSQGEGFNELRFNDKAGEEEIFLHAQKDVISLIENSKTETLNEGSKKIILESKKDPVENVLTIKRGNNKITLNEGDYVIVLDKGNQSITLSDGNQNIVLSKGDLTIDVTGSISIKSTKDITIDSGGAVSIKSVKSTSVDSKDIVDLKAVKDFSLSCMKATMKAQTAVEISGLSVKMQAQTSLDISGLSVKISTQAALNISAMATASISSTAMMSISGAAGLSLSGAMIKLG